MINLHTLILHKSYVQHQNLDEISSLTQLKSIALDQCEHLQNINGIQDITTLTSISIRYCINLQNLPFTKLTNLQDITLTNLSIQNLNTLPKSHKLHSITLCNLKHLTSIDGLTQTTNLQKIDLYGAPNLTNANTLEKLHNLTIIKIKNCENINNITISNKSSIIQNLTIARCINLKQLTIHNDIEQLEIIECDPHILFGTFILHILMLNRSNIINLHPFHNAKELHTLSLIKCNNLHNTNGLHDTSYLKKMIIFLCEKFNEYNIFTKIEYLETDLDIGTGLYPNIILEPIQIKEITLSGKKIHCDEDWPTFDVKILSHMPKLEMIRLGYFILTNTMYFKELKNLKSIYFVAKCKSRESEYIEQLNNDICIIGLCDSH